METKQFIPAPIDGKNLTTDWIEEIFDDYSCLVHGHTFVGFVDGVVCHCTYCANFILWQVNKACAYDELISRLKKKDTDSFHVVYDDTMKRNNVLLQKFYWENED